MKKLFIAVLTILGMLYMTACSTKFNIAAPYKNILVVYGFLDQNDTAHYIRVQKAFLSQSQNALTMASTPDSSFYSGLDVKIKRFNITDTIDVFDTIHLNRVDLDQEGYPKQKGVFFTAPNYAYKFKNTLDPNYLYRIVITNSATGQVDSAETYVIDDNSTQYFYIEQIDTTIIPAVEMDFASTLPNADFTVQGSYNPGATYPSTLSNPASIGQTLVTFNWLDSNGLNQTKTPRSYTYDLGYFYTTGSGSINLTIPDNTLYTAVESALNPAPANTYRLLGRVNLSFYLGTLDFSNYLQYSITQGIGLTGSQIEPVYTNINGANTIGLFTARALRTGLMTMDLNTIDSLKNYSLLSSANIAGPAY